MDFVKLFLSVNHKNYSYDDASNIEMSNLGLFLIDDVSCYRSPCYSSPYKEWALDPSAELISGNFARLEKEGDYIFLSDLHEDNNSPELKLTPEQLVKILDDWGQLVCEKKPQEVTIKHINDEFIFETK